MSSSNAQLTMPGAPHAAASLRFVLGLDAATCVAMGLLLVAAAAVLSPWLGLPEPLLYWAGVLLFPCAALMAAAAAMRPPPPRLVGLVIAGNAAWVLASVAVALWWFEPTPLGVAFVLLQAAAVLLLMALEWRGLAAARA